MVKQGLPVVLVGQHIGLGRALGRMDRGHVPLVHQTVDLRPAGPQALSAGADVHGKQLLHQLDGRTTKDHAAVAAVAAAAANHSQQQST